MNDPMTLRPGLVLDQATAHRLKKTTEERNSEWPGNCEHPEKNTWTAADAAKAISLTAPSKR